MAKRHSMRDGPLAQLFKATERSEAAAVRREPEPEPDPEPTARPQVVDRPARSSAARTSRARRAPRTWRSSASSASAAADATP